MYEDSASHPYNPEIATVEEEWASHPCTARRQPLWVRNGLLIPGSNLIQVTQLSRGSFVNSKDSMLLGGMTVE